MVKESNIDKKFISELRGWITGFHGDILPLTESAIQSRVYSYINQEELFGEKIGFIFNQLKTIPKLGLDIGSSAGGLGVALAMKGVEMEGVEPSQAGVLVSKLRANKRRLKNVNFTQGVGEYLPFPDHKFDFVISLAVLEHVQDVDKVIRETYRVLKPGGRVYFEVPNNIFPFEAHYKMIWLPMMPKFIAKRYVQLRGAHPDFLNHLHYMNKFKVIHRFKKAGFINVRDVYANYITGKSNGDPWASKNGRLAKLRFMTPIFKLIFGYFPTSWFINRAIYLIAEK